MIFISVDLPAPFSPSTAWIWPGATRRLTPSLARTAGYCLVIPVSSSRSMGSRGWTNLEMIFGADHGGLGECTVPGRTLVVVAELVAPVLVLQADLEGVLGAPQRAGVVHHLHVDVGL